MSSFFTRFKRFAGIDIRSDKYTCAKDPTFGHTATSRIPERWVKTTCGYCSVGCGMLLGVRDNQAVSARGNPDHPVNRGKLCPKGLSEHHILSAPGRAKQPLLRKNGVLTPVSWDEALDTMAERFRDIQLRHGNESLGVVGTGQLLTEEFYTLGKLVQLGLRTPLQSSTQNAPGGGYLPGSAGRWLSGPLCYVLPTTRSPLGDPGNRRRRKHPTHRSG
jgi:anaerobic selenocysteine-containing dehydrogenase